MDVKPVAWLREQRGTFEGPQTLGVFFLLGPEKPGNYDHGATYEPLYDQATLEAAVAAERERCAQVCIARIMGDNNREDAEARRCADAIRKG